MRRLNAVFLALLMATLSLAGCFGGDENENLSEDSVETLDDWTVYMVDSGDDLPNCNSDTLGRLYYVTNIETFEVCLTTGWSFIDIKGADGAQGPQGDMGADGAQGPAGETGPQGEPGMDGQAANETMMYDLEQQLLVMNQDMTVLLSNISEIKNDLGGVDNTIQLYYSWFTQINGDVIDLQSNVSLVWDAIYALESDLANATSCQLGRYAYCAGADLSYMNLTGMDLTGIDLRGANLQNTTFDYATLDGADLRAIVAMNATFFHTGMNDTYLQKAEFNRYSSDCSGFFMGLCGAANLSNANLYDADLTDAYLLYVDLINAELRYADLTNADIRYANLTDADIRYADLDDSYLTWADLTDASMTSADLTNADMRYAVLTDALLNDADLSGADLWDADLTDANLYGADLNDADLRYADLTDATLTYATLRYADLSYADFTGALSATYADFENTVWLNTIWTDGVAYNTNQA